MYRLFQAQEDLLARLRPLALDTAGLLRSWDTGHPATVPLSQAAAALRLLEGAGTTHRKPAFGLDRVRVGGREVAVREEAVLATPFCTLRRFAKDLADPGPPVLVVAPMSGHFATRLRGTLEALLPEHDVHVTDWADAREVPAAEGPFGLDDMVAWIVACLEALGPGAHLLAVSQPAVAALAAAALMAEDASPARPRSLTLIAGPVDARVSPTREESLARLLPLAWIERAAVDTVPPGHPGTGRRVRPGAQQITSSVLSDLPRHLAAQLAQVRNLLGGDAAAAAAHRRLYGALRAVMDVPAELYLDTVRRIFREHELALGRMAWRGRPVRPEAIRGTALLAVEGGRDETCPPGQTRAALELCSGLGPALKRHHLQPGAGHDDLFEGPVWATEIYPLVREVIRASDRR
jgi:poly(3-hydroxybutyrate) depolymerase